MLKAAAGGGGKGMRVVRSDAELASAWETTRGEARAAFGDERVYVERAIEKPRHVEAQILADARRPRRLPRRARVLGAAPPPEAARGVPLSRVRSRRRAPRSATRPCRIAREVGLPRAGTVEFILDEQNHFYFLEVNTRLQVEHPVTEMVTGLDLVAEQIAIAEGRPLSFGDAAPEPRGWSMEARIIAEDPSRNFMPSTGRIERVRFPQGPGVRNDAGVYRGYEIPVYYDSLLAEARHLGCRSRAGARAAWAVRSPNTCSRVPGTTLRSSAGSWRIRSSPPGGSRRASSTSTSRPPRSSPTPPTRESRCWRRRCMHAKSGCTPRSGGSTSDARVEAAAAEAVRTGRRR